MKQRVLTTGQVAEFCGVNFRTVIRWIERGQIKSYKLPGRGDNRIEVKDFLEFLKKHQMPIPQEFTPSEVDVLIVEDDATTSAIIDQTLKQAGYSTQMAHNGFMAGAFLSTHKPKLVTLDLDMPGLGGLDVLAFLRGNPVYAKVKVMIISAAPVDQHKLALKMGANKTLTKPLDTQSLVDQVGQLLSQ